MIGLSSEEKVRAAARWLSEQDPAPTHVVNVIKTKFSLRALEACEACRLAQTFRSQTGASSIPRRELLPNE